MIDKKIKILFFFIFLNLIPHIYVSMANPDILLNWYLSDDAFYYFKTAQNIVEGRGITFDGLAHTNGFHPLWMLICIPVFTLTRLNLFMPLRVIIIIQAILNAGTGYFLYRIFSDNISEKTGWFAAFFWMFFTLIHEVTTKLGMESGLNAFSTILYFYAISKLPEIGSHKIVGIKQIIFISLAAVMVLFSRLDNIFILVMVGVWVVFRNCKMRWITLIDFLLILVSAVISYFIRFQFTDNIFYFLDFGYWLVILALIIKPLVFYFLGLYSLNYQKPLSNNLVHIFLAVSVSSGLIGLILFLLFDVLNVIHVFSGFVLLIDYGITLGSVNGFRILLIQFSKRAEFIIDNLSFRNNWQEWFIRFASYFAPLFTSLAGYMVLNKSYAGSAMPVSGQIKRWWGILPNTIYGRPLKTIGEIAASLLDSRLEFGPFWMITLPIRQLAEWVSRLFGISDISKSTGYVIILYSIWVVFVIVIAAVILKNRKSFCQFARQIGMIPFFTGVIFHAISFKASGYLHTRYWYWIGEMILIVLFFGLIITEIIKNFRISPRLLQTTIGFICVGLYTNFFVTILNDFQPAAGTQQYYEYEKDVEFIKDHTNSGDIIGMTGGGFSAYFISDRYIVNLDGLINSAAYFEDLKGGNVNGYLDGIGADFIYGDEAVLLDSDPYRWYFTGRLAFLEEGPYYKLYRYCSVLCE